MKNNQKIITPIKISFGITLGIIILSLTGVFQGLEWAIFDQFFRLRLQEKKEERVVIVAIDEEDITREGSWPLSDQRLTELLTKIKAQKPRVIGLDIFRDLPVKSGHDKLVKLMQSTPNLIGIEKVAREPVAPPPTLAELNQVAAADLISDGDGKIRRALISIQPENGELKLALGTKLALTYLEKENITLEVVDEKTRKYKLGKSVFSPLKKNDGGYINADVGGYQTILNYQGKPKSITSNCIFHTVSMGDILQDKIEPDLMTDKIVLIGVTAISNSDFFYNPYSYSDATSITGVEIHAHLISMILNAAIKGNYLIKTVPELVEWLWILFWSNLGAVIVSRSVHSKNNALWILTLSLLLIVISYGLFLLNWWIPMATPLIALITASTTSLVYTLWENLNLSYQKLEEYAFSLEEKVAEKTKDLAEKNLQLEIQNIDLIEARKMADSANEAKSRFLANMSHELRTPLNAIIGFSYLMNKDKGLDVKQKEFVGIINNSAEHLLSLINDILDISKIEAEKITLDEEEFDLSQMLQSLREMLILKAQSKNLELIFDLAENLPQYIKTDQKKLRQILINLLNNAIKFTAEGSVELKASLPLYCDLVNPETQEILFSVKDTGKGIKKEEIARLFRPFEQTETGKKSNEGTGLGLSISKKFVELLGGDIKVESEVNKGTCFIFNIKAKLAQENEIITQNKKQNIIKIDGNENPPKIIIVDDIKENCQLLENILLPLGFEVKIAYNGQEAVKIWSDWQPNLILMDLHMPVMDGYDAISMIKTQEKAFNNISHAIKTDTKIIAVTASILREDECKLEQLGCDDLVRKPFTENVILEKIKAHLQLNYIYDENQDLSNDNNVNNLTNTQTIEADLKQMPDYWREQVIIAANKGSDDDLLELMEEIPSNLSSLQQKLSYLTNQFEFEEIVTLMTSIEEKS